ncbi:MAG: hypothetical protein ACR2KJ_07450 [Jatrophihabitans sp.]
MLGATRSTHSEQAAGAVVPDSAELGQISRVLTAHAQALVRHDRAAFSAGVDTRQPSGGYRDRQLAEFANIAAVPLASWGYGPNPAPVTGPLLTAAATRYGVPTAIVSVQLRYALRGVDPQPTERPQWISLVRRDGRWLLAGDTDVTGNGGDTWHGLWDFGPVTVYRGASSLVLAHPRNAAREAQFAALVDRAVPVVTSVWGSGWAREVAVLIPDTQDEMSQMIGQDIDLADIAAVAVADDVEVPAGRVLGQRVVLNPANLDRLTTAGRQLVVQHEVTHIATRVITQTQTPTWLVEGFADYVANLHSTQTVRQTALELGTQVRAGHTPPTLPTSADFTGAASRSARAYQEGWLACRLIANLAGQDGLVRFYRRVAAATDPVSALGPALRAAVGADVPAFTARWRAYLAEQLGTR